MLVIHTCPECGLPAEETDRFVLDSTDGPVEHVALRCARKHHFRMPVDILPTSFAGTPDPGSDAAETVTRHTPPADRRGVAGPRWPAREYNRRSP